MKIRRGRILLCREQSVEFGLLRGRGFEQKHDVVEGQRSVGEASIELRSSQGMNTAGYGLQAIRIHGASDAIRRGGFGNSGKTRQQTRDNKGEDTQKARKFRMDEGHKGESLESLRVHSCRRSVKKNSQGCITLAVVNKIPAFHELPVRKDAPPESSWGVFGENDALGCLNFLTPAGIVEAAGLVRNGKVFRLDAKIGFAKPPLFGRASMTHRVIPLGPSANDDILDGFNTQEGSQWDGFGHVGHVSNQLFYNGVTVEETRDGRNARLGIHHWADKFVGRGVMIDAFGYRKARGIPVEPLSRDVYTLSELKAALEAQQTTMKPGSILLIRTGWVESYERATAEAKRDLAPMEKLNSAGIEASREMAEWLWNNRVAAIGTDCPGVEAFPFDFTDPNALHYRALPLLGLPLGELFVLAPLAEDCAKDRRYEFMLVSAPLNVEGGIASPPNAVAIK